MIFLYVLSIILVLFVLLLMVPIGVDVGYDDSGLRLYARVSCITIQVFPLKKKEKKPKAAKKPKKKKSKTGAPDITRDEVLDLIETAVRAIRKLRFHMHKLRLHFISAFADPYQTAMYYGYASAAVHAFGLPQCKRADVQLGVDFEREKCVIDGYLSITIKIYYIMKLCVCLVCGLIPVLLRRRKRMKVNHNSGAVKGKVV